MLVVADTSPLIVLINIDQIAILPKLFERIVVPPDIVAELAHPNRPADVRSFIASRPSWLHEQAPTRIETIPTLHAGELAAISLARELNADLLLIDEIRGRQAASRLHLRFTGTVGVLELAAQKKFLDLRKTFERLKQSNFWISHELLDERLRLHEARPQP